jgi:hypothetical protein
VDKIQCARGRGDEIGPAQHPPGARSP